MILHRAGSATALSNDQLGQSWVVESDGDDIYEPAGPSYSTKSLEDLERSSLRKTDNATNGSSSHGYRNSPSQKQAPQEEANVPRNRSSRTSIRASAEPELIMP